MMSVKSAGHASEDSDGCDSQGRGLNKQSVHGSCDWAPGHSWREGKNNVSWETDIGTVHFKTVIIM